MYVNKSRTIPEVFEVVREAKTKEDKIKLLKAYRTKGLMFIINGMYNVDWSTIDIPKYKPNHRPPEICNANINNSVTRIDKALHYSTTKPQITDNLLSITLAEVSADEAQLLVDMFKGKKVPGISKAIFKEAYPQFFRFQDSDENSETEGK